MPSRLLNLATELLALIAEQLQDDHQALRTLALVCRKLQGIAENVLYRNIFLQTSQQCTRLHRILEVRSSRVTSLSSLEAPCVDRSDQMRHYLPLLSDIIGKARNLKTLMIESPVCNYGLWQHHELWRELMPLLFAPLAESVITGKEPLDVDRPLQRLRSLTLHWNGDQSRYWTIENDYGKLFALPTLEELTLSCCIFPRDALACVRDLPRSPLKHLDLVECNINPSAFHDILSRPKSLKRLSLGENRWHRFDTKPIGDYNNLLASNSDQFLSALRQQESSLEHLSYCPATDTHYSDHFRSTSHLPSGYIGFASFEKLTSLHLDGISPLLERILANNPPPNLATVKVEGYHLAMEDFPDLAPPGSASNVAYKDSNHLHRICRRLSTIKSLQQVEVVMPQGDRTWDVHRQAMEAAVYEFNHNTVHVTLWRAPTYYSSIIPPYLHGESAPVPRIIYDSQADGWMEDEDASLADYLELELGEMHHNVLDDFDFETFLTPAPDDHDPGFDVPPLDAFE